MIITQQQVVELAKPFVSMLTMLEEFYRCPDNEKAYREWHLQKYGTYPGKEIDD